MRKKYHISMNPWGYYQIFSNELATWCDMCFPTISHAFNFIKRVEEKMLSEQWMESRG